MKHIRINIRSRVVIETIAAVCAIGVVTVIMLNNHDDSTPTIEDCVAAIGNDFDQNPAPVACRKLSDIEQSAALAIAIDRANSASPSQATSALNVALIPNGEFGKPVDIDGHFTITMTQPVDATNQFHCLQDDGKSGSCGPIALVDVIITATDAIDLCELMFSGSTPNGYSVGGTAVGERTMQPGTTHVTRELQLHYENDATTLQAQLWLAMRGDPTHLAEWTWDGK